MTTQLYLDCLIACLIGNAIHIAAKANSLSRDFKSANLDFSFVKDFLKPDKYALIFDLVSSVGMVFVADEIVDSPYLLGKIKLGFILIGVGGSYLVMQLLSKAKRPFRNKVDVATDHLDGKIKPE
jgi:hypothetical protein